MIGIAGHGNDESNCGEQHSMPAPYHGLETSQLASHEHASGRDVE